MTAPTELDERALHEARKVLNANLADGDILGATERVIRSYLSALPASGAGREAETKVLHWIIERLGGHSVTLVRDGERLLGWNTGKAHNSIAIRDLFSILPAAPDRRAGE